MANFKVAQVITARSEGIYDNDPTDRGGETVLGIARKSNPNWEGWELVDRIRDEFRHLPYGAQKKVMMTELKDHTLIHVLANDLYKRKYWDSLRLDKVQSQKIANELYDTSVNQGSGTAAKYLQEALNLLNNDSNTYEELVVDGGIGLKTLTTLEKYLKTSRWSSRTMLEVEKTLVKTMNGLQFMKYVEIVKKNPSQEKFFYGWVNRRI